MISSILSQARFQEDLATKMSRMVDILDDFLYSLSPQRFPRSARSAHEITDDEDQRGGGVPAQLRAHDQKNESRSLLDPFNPGARRGLRIPVSNLLS